MLPKHLTAFFTHLAQSQDSADENKVFVLRQGNNDAAFDRDLHSNLELFYDQPNTPLLQTAAVDHNFYDFSDAIRANSPVRAWSTSSIYAPVHYQRFRVTTNLYAPYDERRHIVYDQRPEVVNAVLVEQEEEVYEVGLQQTSFFADTYPDLLQRKTFGLPDAVGSVSYLLDVQADVENKIDFATIEDSNESAIAFLPNLSAGWLSSLRVGDYMEELTCEGVAWGFLIAAAYKDTRFIVAGLKELIRQAKKREWLTNLDGEWVINPNVTGGFETYFSLTDTYTTRSIKEISGNAFLGYAVCVALASLTDQQANPGGGLIGANPTFRRELLLALEALALFCARAISPSTYWAAYKEQLGYYSYDAPSVSASYYTDLFLSAFLSFKYNQEVHTKAGWLRLSLINASPNLDDPIYSSFVERDFSSLLYPYEPLFLQGGVYNEEDTQTYTDLYSKQSGYAARSLWLSYHNKTEELSVSFDNYEQVRSALFIEVSVSPNYPDSVTLLAYHLAQLKWQIDLGELLTDTTIDLLTVAGFKYPNWSASDLTNWLDVLDTPELFKPFSLAAAAGPRAFPTAWVFQLGIASIIANNFVASLLEPFTLEVEVALAGLTSMLLELRRMMPYGLKWFSVDLVDKVTSVIGGLLYAEASLYFGWSLQLDLLEKSLSPLSATSEHAQQWYKVVYDEDILASDGFIRSRFQLDQTTSIQSMFDFTQYLMVLLGAEVTLNLPSTPAFRVLTTLTHSNDSATVYSDGLHTIDLTADDVSLNDVQYYSIFFKKAEGEWTSRLVAGFPIRDEDVPVETDIMTAAEYLANPTAGVLVEDGEMLVYPLSDFLMQAEIDLGNQPVPAGLSYVTSRMLPAGLLVNYTSTFESAGDE